MISAHLLRLTVAFVYLNLPLIKGWNAINNNTICLTVLTYLVIYLITQETNSIVPGKLVLANMDSQKPVKPEVERLGDDYMNITVEEHSIKVEFNQELDAPRGDYLDIKVELKQELDTTEDGNICLPSQLDDIEIDEHPTQVVQRIDTSVKPYQCNECNKCFTHQWNLVTHKRTHTGDKPYQCSHCDKCFNQKGSLVRHQRMHTGDKPYQCSHCDKCFADRSSLVNHLRRHTGDKPYQCSHCDKCFIYQDHLVRH